MNNLLIKTAEFLFIPEAVLSTVFLIFFVVIFAFGVQRQIKCKEFLQTLDAQAEENFKTLSAKMSPEMFIKKNLRNLSVAEDLLEELPNVFVSVGIVATFLGLGVAIQGAAELLQTDKLELSKLTAVLGVIAFKFQTSVWGICFSIVFRNVILERYFDFRRQIVDELTNRLYMLERENARTLIERQNELIVAHHKEMLNFNAAHHEDLVEALSAFKSVVHEDNLAANERLRYLAENFNEFVAVAQDFATDERAFAESVKTFSESVDSFTERVKIFQEEFAFFIHKELVDLRAVNENLGLIHAEHIKEIHNQHASNIFKTTEELDKLHQKFYLDSRRFAQECCRTLDNLLDTTLGRVHDEYTKEAQEIRSALSAFSSLLSKIENNLVAVNQEFTAEQKHFVDSWHIVMNRISETMTDLAAASAKDNERLDTLHNVIEGVAHNMQNNTADNFKQATALMQATADNFRTASSRLTALQKEFYEFFKTLSDEQNTANALHLDEIAAHSKAMVDAVKVLQKNFSKLESDNQVAAKKLRDELVAVRGVLESLTALVRAEDEKQKKVAEHFPASTRKLVPVESGKSKPTNIVDGRDEK